MFENRAAQEYQAVIFDLDGVICHTDQYHYLAWKAIAEELGVYFDEKINSRLRGVSRSESLEIILELYEGVISADQKKDLMEKKNLVYRRYLEELSLQDIDPLIKSTMDAIRNKGLKLAVGSSSKNTGLILEKLGLKDYFDAVADGNEVLHSKPDPEVFLLASEKLGIAPVHCLVVEDARAGLLAAASAGMDGAAIGEAAHCRPSEQKIAKYTLEKFSDLLAIVDNVK